MAGKNWRSNDEPQVRKSQKKSAPGPSSSDPVHLGPIVRAISLILVAVALAFCGKALYDYLSPDDTTAILMIDSTDEQSSTDRNAVAVYRDESRSQFMTGIDNLKPVNELHEVDSMHGPDEDVMLFYMYGDLSSHEGKLYISQNQSSGGAFETTAWQPLYDKLNWICDQEISSSKQVSHRIVFLDIENADGAVRFGSEPLSKRIESLLTDLNNDPKTQGDANDLWVMISADGAQNSWYAPEIGGSAFSFFVAKGLAGWADQTEEQISLDELFRYVEQSVASWAKNYRSSIQTPKLVSLNSEDLASKISVIYSDPNPEVPRPIVDYPKTAGCDELWYEFNELKELFGNSPYQLAKIEAMLVRMEQIRYGSTGFDSRSSRAFNKLKSAIETQLADLRLQGAKKTNIGPISLAQTNLVAAESRLTDLNNYLFPEPSELPTNDADTAENGDSNKEQANETKPAAEPAPQFEDLRLLERTNLVWQFLLRAPKSNSEKLTADHFKKCLRFINEAGTSSDDQQLEFVESQFLKILIQNLDWYPSSNPEFLAQRTGFLAAIECRQQSESIIQGTGFDASRFARAWPRVRNEYKQLEARRRKAEDNLLANQNDIATNELTKLAGEYKALANEIDALIQLRRVAEETLLVSPYLRKALEREITWRGSNSEKEWPELEKRLLDVEDIELLSINTLKELSGPKNDSLDATALQDRWKPLERLRKYFIAYQNRLRPREQSASDPVFQAINLLTTPIPEWLATPFPERLTTSEGLSTKEANENRKTVRDNLDFWIGEQNFKFDSAKEWTASNEITEFEDPATYGADLLKLFDPNLKELAQVDLRSTISIVKHLSSQEDKFAQTPRALADANALIALQEEFAKRDFQIRLENQVLCNGNHKALDIGPQLAVIDEMVVASDKLERARLDFWGDGDVTKFDHSLLPPFVDYCNYYHELFKTNMESLASKFKTGAENEDALFVVDALRDDMAGKFEHIKQSWITFQNAKLIHSVNGETVPADSSTIFNLKNDEIKIGTILETELIPSKELEAPSLAMSNKLKLNRESLTSTELFEFPSESEPAPSSVPTKLLGQTNMLESIVGFRGHRFTLSRTLEAKVSPVTKEIPFEITHKQYRPEASFITVKNNEDFEADIVFILDCSGSMTMDENVVFDRAGEKRTRFYVAKQALVAAIDQLKLEHRFQFGLYAFGHRVAFQLDKNGDLVLDENNRFMPNHATLHPFDDCEQLFRLAWYQDNDPPNKYVELIKKKISDIGDDEAKGITPLYYSIKKAADDEFIGARERKRRYIVALTDGDNLQVERGSVKGLPVRFDDIGAQTRVGDVKKALDEKGIRLLVARIGKDKGGTSGTEELERIGADVIKILDKNSDVISNEILNALGRSKFSLLRPGTEKALDSKQIEPSTFADLKREDLILQTTEKGRFVVKALGLDGKSNYFEIALAGGEDVSFVNTKDGLELVSPRPRFMPDEKRVDDKETIDFVPGKRYDIGRLKARRGLLEFGFYKTVEVKDSPSKNFGFRPQRVWAQVTDPKSGLKTNIFLSTFVARNRFPVARFTLPEQLLEQSDRVDVRLWVVPNELDGWPADPPIAHPISLGENFFDDVRCNYQEIDPRLHTITIECGDAREFFVDCPDFETLTRKTVYEFEQSAGFERKLDVFEFAVDRNKANFAFSVLPAEEYESVMNDVNNSQQSWGKSKDPVFGGAAIWINFENIDIGD